MSRELMEMGYKALAEAQKEKMPDVVYTEKGTYYPDPPKGFKQIEPVVYTAAYDVAPVLAAGGMAAAVGKLQKAAFPQSQNVVAPLLTGIGTYVLARGARKKIADRLALDTHNVMKKVGL